MFELIIFEIIGFLELSSRYFHWRLGLTLLLFMVIALIPFYIAISCISNIQLGESLEVFSEVKLVIIKKFLFSAKTMEIPLDVAQFLHLFVRILANWGLISVTQCL